MVERGERHTALPDGTALLHTGAKLTVTKPEGIRVQVRRSAATSAPGPAHICAGTCPHLRRDLPTSAPGLTLLVSAQGAHVVPTDRHTSHGRQHRWPERSIAGQPKDRRSRDHNAQAAATAGAIHQALYIHPNPYREI
jgi:hypothetical protein